MIMTFIACLISLIRVTFLILRPSLPLQGLSLFLLRISVATFSGTIISPLLGVYTVLIYSRGLLVLLAYFIALSPNQTLNTPSLLFIFRTLFLITALTFQIFPYYSVRHSPRNFLFSSSITAALNPTLSSLLISIGVILILTIIAVVKVTSLRRKPIRPWK